MGWGLSPLGCCPLEYCEVAALVLERLLQAAAQPDATFEVSAVVSQPGRPKGRGNKKVPQPSEVEQLARASGLQQHQILCPEKATDKQFLECLRQLGPDLCVTAAYGNYLPTAFLAIPRHGTLNIHPSLLPKYRGAAPAQRALQDGAEWTGVSLLYTVKEMDAGPVLAQKKVKVDPDIQAPEFLKELFTIGADLLLDYLELVWAGMAAKTAVAQDSSQATHAAKIGREEAALDFSRPALELHNQVRAFAGWPGTTATFTVRTLEGEGARSSAGNGSRDSSGSGSGTGELLELKIVRTRVASQSALRGGGGGSSSGGNSQQVVAGKDGMFIRCGDGSVLEVLEVQVPGKKVATAKDFANGLNGRVLEWQEQQQQAAAETAPAP
ncbi:hypothetical protein N2152v2_006208 [Parachlorella kessleri]